MKKQIAEIIKRLEKLYPGARTELNYKNPLELLVATILSAQCTDERVNKVTRKLFLKYQKPEDYLKVPIEELENDIRPTGFYRNKAKTIRGAMEKIQKDFQGKVPDNMKDLVSLPGVARKTANVVLANAFSAPEGIAVDTHVKRVARRLGLSTHQNPDKIEKDLTTLIPREKWIDVNHQLILFGRYICQAKKPAFEKCPLTDICPYFQNSKCKSISRPG